MKPTIGRIVRYIDGVPGQPDATEWPAIITVVHNDNGASGLPEQGPPESVSLQVFRQSDVMSAYSVPFDGAAQRSHTWHWPERTS
jgi:hypothetical protein